MPLAGQSWAGVATPFITILSLLLLGAVLRRWGIVTHEGARQMTRLVLDVTLPALILISLATELTPKELGRAPLLVVMGVVGPLVGYAVGTAFGRLPLFPVRRQSTLQAAVGMLNTTFIGYPVCAGLLGSEGLLYAVLYDAGFTLLMSTFCVWLFNWGSGERRMSSAESVLGLVRSPLMWAVVLGLAWGAAGQPVPVWVRQPLQTLGQATMPLALLIVGVLVQPAERAAGDCPALPPSSHRWQFVVLIAARLVVVPALVWILALAMRIDRSAAAVIVLQTAMPTAVATTAMAEQYGGDSAFAAAGVVGTTFLSLLTLPVWSWVLLG